MAIGKMGRNIALASRLTGVEIHLQEVSQEVSSAGSSTLPGNEEDISVKEEPGDKD